MGITDNKESPRNRGLSLLSVIYQELLQQFEFTNSIPFVGIDI